MTPRNARRTHPIFPDRVSPSTVPGTKPPEPGMVDRPSGEALARRWCDMDDVLALVLAGGRGTRLRPLTMRRAKPAMPIGGHFRVIDFVLSNCRNSGIPRVGVLTQYKEASLTPSLDFWDAMPGAPAVRVLASGDVVNGYRGTADAVWQHYGMIRSQAPSDVLVLAADHVYAMDYGAMLLEHRRRGASVTVGCVEVPLAEAHAFGVMAVDGEDRIRAFAEKPHWPAATPGRPGHALISMGIYIFETGFLLEALARDTQRPDSTHDFGHDVLPAAVAEGSAHVHRLRDPRNPQHTGYWRDVGTVDAYWQTNLDLAAGTPSIPLEDAGWPITGSLRSDDPDGHRRNPVFADSIVPASCMIGHAEIHRSVLAPGLRIGWGSRLEGCVLLPGAHVGPDCLLRNVIVEEGCRLPQGTVIGIDRDRDRQRYTVSDSGVTIVSSQETIPGVLRHRDGHARQADDGVVPEKLAELLREAS